MAEQDAPRRPPPLRISWSPFESDSTALPSSAPYPYVTEYDMHAGDHGLPAMDFDPRRPQAPQNSISRDQRLSPANSRSAVAHSSVHQSFESGPIRNPASVRPFQAKPKQTRTNQNTHTPRHTLLHHSQAAICTKRSSTAHTIKHSLRC